MEQQDTTRHHKWKIRLKYLTGVLGLAATGLLALFLPKWYSGWQDARLLDQVTLSKSEGIQFLDTDAIDVSARLQMLADTTFFGYSEGTVLESYKEETDLDLINQCRDSLKKWSSCHLMPEGILDAAVLDDEVLCFYYYVQIDAGVIPVVVLSFLSDPYLQVIMDGDNGFLYCVGYAGEDMYDYIYQHLGVENDEEFSRSLENGTYSLDQICAPSWYEFAALAGADTQEVVSTDFSGLFLEMDLSGEQFSSKAYRILFEHMEYGNIGLAVMFGNQNWWELARLVSNYYDAYGFNDQQLSVNDWIEEWNHNALEYGRPDLLQEETEDTYAIVESRENVASDYDGK